MYVTALSWRAISMDELFHTGTGVVDKLSTCRECCWESKILRWRSWQQPENIPPRGWRTPSPLHWRQERYEAMTRGWNGSKQVITQEVCLCVHASGILQCLHICTYRWQCPGSGQTAFHSCPVRRLWSWWYIDLVRYHGVCVRWQQLKRLYCQSETFPSLWHRTSRLTVRKKSSLMCAKCV